MAAVRAQSLGLPFRDLAVTVDPHPTVIPCGHDAMIIEPQAVTDCVTRAAEIS